MNAALDIAIGLVLMYLVLSLFCTTLNEFIANLLSLRATTLKAALQELIDDPNLRSLFYNHGLIDGAKTASTAGASPTTPTVDTKPVVAPIENEKMAERPAATPVKQGFFAKLAAGWKNEHPSYLSSKTVAMALIGSLGTTKDAPIPEFKAVADAVVKGLPDCNIRDVLSTCIAQSEGDIDKLRDNVANWFDSAMDRLSGAYKRSIKRIAVVIGLLVAIGFNADTLKVARTLWSQPQMAASISQAAATLVANNQKSKASSQPTADQKQQKPGATGNSGSNPPAQSAAGQLPSAAGGSGGTVPPPPANGSQSGNTTAGNSNGGSPPAKSTAAKQDSIDLPASSDCQKPKEGAPDLVNDAYKLCQANAYLQDGPLSVLPIGWHVSKQPSVHDFFYWLLSWTGLLQILGWLITAVALTLGAPFWFDLLIQFVNLRGTGQKPEPAAKSAKGS